MAGQPFLEPVLFGLPPRRDIGPGIGPADDGAHRDGHDVEQPMPLGAVDPGIGEIKKNSRRCE